MYHVFILTKSERAAELTSFLDKYRSTHYKAFIKTPVTHYKQHHNAASSAYKKHNDAPYEESFCHVSNHGLRWHEPDTKYHHHT